MQQGIDPETRSRSQSIRLCGQHITEPGHICAFFDSRDEKYATLAPYFIDSFAAGDCVINIVDRNDRDGHLDALTRAHVPIDDAVRRDRFRLMTSEETYLRKGELDLHGMLDMLRGALQTAQRDGYSIRTCGEMSWVGRHPRIARRVMEYEARVNEFVPTFDCTLLCVYDVAAIPAAMISDILATHPHAIINGRLRPNPYFVPPVDYLAMLQSRSGRGSTASPS